MEEATRALASIAGPRRDDQKAKGQETGWKDDGLMTSQGTLMAESISVDGAQQVRGAEDVRVSNVQGVQGYGNRASSGSGGIAGTEAHCGAAEDAEAKTFGTSISALSRRFRVRDETIRKQKTRKLVVGKAMV
jgi:hypothetical protein